MLRNFVIPIKMEKYEWINPDNHSIAVDDQKQPVLNENGDLIVLDNESEYYFKIELCKLFFLFSIINKF